MSRAQCECIRRTHIYEVRYSLYDCIRRTRIYEVRYSPCTITFAERISTGLIPPDEIAFVEPRNLRSWNQTLPLCNWFRGMQADEVELIRPLGDCVRQTVEC
jgi:hypothetical protein